MCQGIDYWAAFLTGVGVVSSTSWFAPDPLHCNPQRPKGPPMSEPLRQAAALPVGGEGFRSDSAELAASASPAAQDARKGLLFCRPDEDPEQYRALVQAAMDRNDLEASLEFMDADFCRLSIL